MSIIVNGVELTEVIYAGVNLDTVKVKKGTAEAVTIFEKITQLATPQNVSANGTTVSWDAVENATSYAVLADGSEIGTVEKEKLKFYADESTAQTFRDWADYLYSTVFNSDTVGVHLFEGYEAVPHYLLMTSEYCTIDDDTTKRTHSMTTSERDHVKAEIEKIIALAGDAHDLDSIRDLNCVTNLKKYSETMFAFMDLTLKVNSIVGQTTYKIVDAKGNILANITAQITL